MNGKAVWKDRSRVTLYSVVVFFVLSFFFLVITYAFQTVTDRDSRALIRKEEQSLIGTEKAVASLQIERLIADTLFVKDSMRLFQPEGKDLSLVAQTWLVFAEHSRIYDQVRFLDSAGSEVLRIDNDDGVVSMKAQEDLQDKSDRYYFQAAINLPEDELYVSKIDLNIENGAIVYPLEPAIRLATPMFDTDGAPAGIVVLNYNAEGVLSQFGTAADASNGALFLLDADSYWVYNSADPDKEWGSMLEDRAGFSFAAEYPDEWQTIVDKGAGTLTTANGFFTYDSVLTGLEESAQDSEILFVPDSCGWYIVSFLSADTEKGRLFTDGFFASLWKTIRKNGYAYFMIAFIALVIAVLFTANRQENEQIRYFSDYDVMTGVYNRRAGLEKLYRLKEQPHRCEVSLCYVDINGLKEVNDSLGHRYGDELIVSVVSEIRRNIRENDFLARLGGDEFLVIFENMTPEACEAVWQRIVSGFERINRTGERGYVVSASHGIEPFYCAADGESGIDAAVNRADAKMYAEKRTIKQRLRVVRSTQPQT